MLYTVNRTPLVWIPMRDGTKLAAKLWIPGALVDKSTAVAEEVEKFPAILGKNFLFVLIAHISSASMP